MVKILFMSIIMPIFCFSTVFMVDKPLTWNSLNYTTGYTCNTTKGVFFNASWDTPAPAVGLGVQ